MKDPSMFGDPSERDNQSAPLKSNTRPFVIPALWAGLGLGIAVIGAVLTNKAGGIGAVNVFAEALSGRSATLLGEALGVIPLGVAFGAGMVSAVNPCGFSMLPAYLGLYLGAQEAEGSKSSALQRFGRALFIGSTVTAGFVVLFGTIGVIIASGGQFLTGIFPWLGLGVGLLLLVAGAFLLAGSKFYSGFASQAATRVGEPGQVNFRGYFVFGISYGIASLSCTLPIFLAVLGSALAVSGFLAALGQFVLYGLGMGLVIMALTIAIAAFKAGLSNVLRRALPHVQTASALLMVLAGSYIVFYWLSIGGLLAKVT